MWKSGETPVFFQNSVKNYKFYLTKFCGGGYTKSEK